MFNSDVFNLLENKARVIQTTTTQPEEKVVSIDTHLGTETVQTSSGAVYTRYIKTPEEKVVSIDTHLGTETVQTSSGPITTNRTGVVSTTGTITTDTKTIGGGTEYTRKIKTTMEIQLPAPTKILLYIAIVFILFCILYILYKLNKLAKS